MDYKNRIPGYRPPRPPRKKNRTGLWAGLAVGVALVAVAIGWAVTRPKDEPTKPEAQTVTVNPAPLPENPPKPGDKKQPVKADGKEPAKPAATDTKATTPPAPPPEPRFTFYKILPEQEAIIPESEIKNLKREESLSKQPPTVKYQLQAGSFTNVPDAEKLKAKLSSLKIKSHIETVKIENTAWSRVKIGPFASLADADKVRTYLKGSGLDSVVQKSVTKPPQDKPAAKPAQTATGR